MKRFLEALSDGVVYFCRVYARGCNVAFRTVVASFIIALFMLPLAVLGRFVDRLPLPLDGTLEGVGVRLLLVGVALLIYLPPVFYVASSWVGFCPRIEAPEERNDQV